MEYSKISGDRVKDPWMEQLLRRPDMQARVHILIRLVELSSLAGLAAGVLLFVIYCGVVV